MGSYASYAVRDSGGNIIGYQSAYTGQITYEGGGSPPANAHTVDTPQPAMSGNTAAEIAQLVGKTGGVVDPSVARIAAAQTATPSAAQEYDYDTNVHPALPPTMYRATETRPGYYASTELGDTATQARAKELMNQPNKPFGSYDDAVRYTLEEQRQAAADSRAKSFYENELTKSIQEPIEAASQYHYMAKETGRAISANPYEYQADLAVELLKGAPVTRSDVFSPVSGEMSKYLPGGAMGVQQHQWNTALGKNENVNFMPGVAALQAAEGIQGPYGALYGGTGVKSITPESVGNVMAAYPRSVVTTMPTQVAGVGPDVTVKSAVTNVPTVGGLYVVPGSAVVFNRGETTTGTGAQQRVETSPAATWLEGGLAAGDALTSLPSTLTGGIIPAWTPGADLLKSQGLSGSQSVNTFQKELAAIESQRPDYDAILSDVQSKTAQLNTLTDGKINDKGEFIGTPKEYERVQALQSDIKTGTEEYNKFQTKYQDVLTRGYGSGAIIKGAGDTYQIAPETERKYGSFSDWSVDTLKLITGGWGPNEFAKLESSPAFEAMPWQARVGEGVVKTITNPEEALQSGIQGVALYAGTAGLGGGLGALSGYGGEVGAIATGATKIGESSVVKYGVPAVFLGAGTYGAAEGVDIGGPTLVSPKAGWAKFESNLGALGGNLAWMGIGASAPGGLAKLSTAQIGSGLKSGVSDKLYTMQQRAAGIENIGPESGLSYYKGEPSVVIGGEVPKNVYATIGKGDLYTRGGEIGEFLDTTPTGWFKPAGRAAQTAESISSLENLPFRATDADRYAILESIFKTSERPLLAPLKPMVVEKPWTTYRRTTTSYDVSPVGTILSQKQPGGLSSTIRIKPGVITEGAPESWTVSPRSKATVISSEAIRLNPYSGETLVLGRTDVLRSPAKIGIPEVSTSKTRFNIFELKPSIAEESAMSVKTPSAGDITSLYFEKKAGTTTISSGAYRDITKPGRGTLYKGYTDEFGYLGESKKTREITSAIKDILESKEPEYGVKLSKYANVPTPRIKIAEKTTLTPSIPIGLSVEPIYETRIAGMPRVSAREVSKEPIPSKGFSTTGQQLKYAEIPVAEKMGATFKSIFGELAKAKPKAKYSKEGTMISARVEQMATRARRAEQLPEETRRFEELQKVTPSLKTVGPIIDTSGYIKYSEAMLKGLKSGGVKSEVSLKPFSVVSEQSNRLERQYGRIDRIGVGVGEITSPSQKSLEKQLQEQIQPTIEKETPSVKSMSETIQKSIQDILKTPSSDITQKQEEIAIRVPFEVTTPTPKETTTQLPRQAQIPEVTSISRVTQIPDLTQRPEITRTPPEKTKLKIPVLPPLFGGSLPGGGGGGAGPRKRYKKHEEVFEYKFDPWKAARITAKALAVGSNVTRGPKSSLPTSIFGKPQQTQINKVTLKPTPKKVLVPKVVVPKFNMPMQKKVTTPQFTTPKIGVSKSTNTMKSISLLSSMPTKKKGKK